MEKYSNFRDQATGVAPFQRPRAASEPLVTQVLKFVIGACVYPLGLLGMLLVSFGDLPVLGPLFTTLVTFVSRVLIVRLQYDGERKASVRKSGIQKAQPGDVLISNFLGPLDPVIYSTLYNCQFVLPNNGNFVPVSLAAAQSQALSLDLAKSASAPIDEICAKAKAAGKVVILFGEGTTSNGKGVLTLKNVDWPALQGVPGAVFASAIKYTSAFASSPVGGNLFTYLWKLQTNIYWLISEINVSKAMLPSSRTKLGAGSALTSVSRLRLVGDALDIDAKQRFAKVSK